MGYRKAVRYVAMVDAHPRTLREFVPLYTFVGRLLACLLAI